MLVQLYFFPSSETTGTVHRLAGASWNVDLQKKNSQTQFNFSGIDLPTPVLSSMWSGVLLSLLCTSSLVLGLLLPPWCSSSTPSRTVSGPHPGPLGPHHPLSSCKFGSGRTSCGEEQCLKGPGEVCGGPWHRLALSFCKAFWVTTYLDRMNIAV